VGEGGGRRGQAKQSKNPQHHHKDKEERGDDTSVKQTLESGIMGHDKPGVAHRNHPW